jgi:hypothetical protein
MLEKGIIFFFSKICFEIITIGNFIMFNAHMSDIIIDMFVVNDADGKQVILTVFLLKLLLTISLEHIQNLDWKRHLQ